MTTETALIIFVAISMVINKTVVEALDEHKKGIELIANYIKETA